MLLYVAGMQRTRFSNWSYSFFLLSLAKAALCRIDRHKSFIRVFEMLKETCWVSDHQWFSKGAGRRERREALSACFASPLSFLIDYEDRSSHQLLAGKWVTKTHDTNVELWLMPVCFWLQIISKLQTILLAILLFQLLSPGIQVIYLVGEKNPPGFVSLSELVCNPPLLGEVLSDQIHSVCLSPESSHW